MLNYSEATLAQAHYDLGKINQIFLDEVKVIKDSEKYIRWKIIVLFYRTFASMKGYLILKKDIAVGEYSNYNHQVINSYVRCRNELGDKRATYISLFKLSWRCRYDPYEIKELNE